MRASFARPCISRCSKRHLSLALLVLSLGGMNEVRADEKAHLRVAAVSASRRTCAAETLRFCLLLQGRTAPTLAEIEKHLSVGYQGVSAADMAELCGSVGTPIRAIKTTFEDLKRLSSPSILHVDDSHFVVFVRSDGERLVLFDNMIGLFDCSRDWFHEHYQWRGTALVLGERTSSLWFFFRSPWALSFSAGVFVMMVGLHLLFARAAKQKVGLPLLAQ